MRKLVAVVIVVAIVGLCGYAAIGEPCLASPGNGVAAAAENPNVVAPVGRPATAASRPATTRPAEGQEDAGIPDATRRAAKANKHLFVFVYEKNNDQIRAGRKTFDSALRKLADTAQWTTVDRTAAAEKEFVAKYGLKSAPMPAVLVFAPNGVIVGGFVGARLTEALLLDSLASPAKQAVLKAVQARKLVFLCVRSGVTKSNEQVMKGVNDFKADARYAEATEIVRLDLSDAAEAKFVTELEIDPKVDQATTVFLAPPNVLVGKYTGTTEKNKLVAALQAASSGGCSGSSGCCPPKK